MHFWFKCCMGWQLIHIDLMGVRCAFRLFSQISFAAFTNCHPGVAGVKKCIIWVKMCIKKVILYINWDLLLHYIVVN